MAQKFKPLTWMANGRTKNSGFLSEMLDQTGSEKAKVKQKCPRSLTPFIMAISMGITLYEELFLLS